jgi:hypothetical protein
MISLFPPLIAVFKAEPDCVFFVFHSLIVVFSLDGYIVSPDRKLLGLIRFVPVFQRQIHVPGYAGV